MRLLAQTVGYEGEETCGSMLNDMYQLEAASEEWPLVTVSFL